MRLLLIHSCVLGSTSFTCIKFNVLGTLSLLTYMIMISLCIIITTCVFVAKVVAYHQIIDKCQSRIMITFYYLLLSCRLPFLQS